MFQKNTIKRSPRCTSVDGALSPRLGHRSSQRVIGVESEEIRRQASTCHIQSQAAGACANTVGSSTQRNTMFLRRGRSRQLRILRWCQQQGESRAPTPPHVAASAAQPCDPTRTSLVLLDLTAVRAETLRLCRRRPVQGRAASCAPGRETGGQ